MIDQNALERSRAALYVEFRKYDQNGDYERALKSINRILQLSADDENAMKCKVVCLIHLNRFDEALSFLSRNAKPGLDMHFEKAYCYYRTNQTEKALIVLDEGPNDHRCKELRAQVHYRLEQYGEALQLYEEIIRDNPNDEYADEHQTNLAAVIAMQKEKTTKNMEIQLKESTYELCYNKALVVLGMEMYSETEKLLKKAEKLLRESFEEEGASEEDTEAELAQIRVLQACCYHKQGRAKEAHALYTNALKTKNIDISLAAVACNNIAVINRDQNIFDSKKKMKIATSEQLLHKLPSSHRKQIALNNAIFQYYCNHHEQVAAACDVVAKTWPDLETKVNILRAMNLNKAADRSGAIELLWSAAEKCVDESDQFLLKMHCVQFLLENGDQRRACEVLESLGEQRYKPGILGALITLYTHLNNEDMALQIFEQAVEWYKKNDSSGMNLTNFYQQAADFHMRSGRPQVAAQSLEQLLAQNPNDLKVVAQLVIAYAQFDEKKAVGLRKRLGDIKDLDIDLNALESSVWLNAKKAPAAAVISKSDVSPGPNYAKKRKNRKKKGKLPKNYDASATPDPERWLPRYERSGYRKKRDRRVREVIKGSQGTTAGHSDQFDYSKFAVDDESGSASVEPSPMQKNSATRINLKKGAQKKKNKRR